MAQSNVSHCDRLPALAHLRGTSIVAASPDKVRSTGVYGREQNVSSGALTD